MPLPKEIKAALETWKEGKGEFPDALDHGVFFPSTGAFDAEVRRKSKASEGAGREAAIAEMLAKLDITDPTQLDSIRETLDKAGVLKTETDKLKAEIAKHVKGGEDFKKEFDTLKATNATLTEKIRGTAKREAISKFAARTSDLAILSPLVEPSLEVGEDGTITVKGGDGKKTIEQLIDETIKAHPVLKNPEFKEGAGTRPTPETKTDQKTIFTPEKDKDGKDKPLPFAQAAINGLAASGYKFQGPDVGP